MIHKTSHATMTIQASVTFNDVQEDQALRDVFQALARLDTVVDRTFGSIEQKVASEADRVGKLGNRLNSVSGKVRGRHFKFWLLLSNCSVSLLTVCSMIRTHERNCKIDAVQGWTKATTVFSPAKFPVPNELEDLNVVHHQFAEHGELTESPYPDANEEALYRMAEPKTSPLYDQDSHFDLFQRLNR